MRRFVHLLAFAFILVALVAALPTPVASDVTPMQQLFVMKEMKPDMAQVGILWDGNVSHDALLPQIQRAAAAAGVKVVVAGLGDIRELAPTFRDLVRSNGIDALWIVEDDAVVGTDIARKYLVKSAAEHGIPMFAPSEKWVDAGACVALRKNDEGIQLIVNRAAASAASLQIPEKYRDRTQYLASR